MKQWRESCHFGGGGWWAGGGSSASSSSCTLPTYIYACVCCFFKAEIELELRVFKYTWRKRGLHECDPVLDGEQLWAVSCVDAFDCSMRGFHQPLPLSLRRPPLPPCLPPSLPPSSTSHTVIRHSYCLSGASAVLPHHYIAVQVLKPAVVSVNAFWLFDVHWRYFIPHRYTC